MRPRTRPQAVRADGIARSSAGSTDSLANDPDDQRADEQDESDHGEPEKPLEDEPDDGQNRPDDQQNYYCSPHTNTVLAPQARTDQTRPTDGSRRHAPGLTHIAGGCDAAFGPDTSAAHISP